MAMQAVHKSRSVSRCLAEHREQIRIFYLPSYNPGLNLDELLNQDVKTDALIWGERWKWLVSFEAHRLTWRCHP
jgi:DDE superfamily endonuclease